MINTHIKSKEFKKIVSVTLPFFMNRHELENSILPLLKASKPPVDISLDEASLFLHSQLKSYIQKYYFDEPETLESALIKIDTYFTDIKSSRVYDEQTHREQIETSIRTLASYLLDLDTSSSFVSDLFFPAIFVAINERSCFDEHSYNLNAILIRLSFSQFSLPIQKILHFLQNKMSSQISLLLRSLDANVFKGFLDTQSSHSVHFASMILDDIFNISGGHYSNDTDILLQRSPLAIQIFNIIFHNKLTIKNILYDPYQDWSSYLAFELSCDMTHCGETHLSLEDLSQSSQFLDFLLKKNLITEDQKTLLEHPDTIQEDQELNFLKPLVTISTEFGSERIVYTPFFAELVIQFITEKINSIPPDKQPSCPLMLYFPSSDVPPTLSSKIFTLFSLSTIQKPFFSYKDIHLVMQKNNRDFHIPFLKPYIPLFSIMIAHCKPKNAYKIYKKWILPNARLSWAQDCLLMMGCMNYRSIKEIGTDVFLNPMFSSSSLNHTLLHRLISSSPQTLTDWIQHQLISIEFLCKPQNSNHYSMLHVLSDLHPETLVLWLQKDYISINHLLSIKDSSGCTVLHWIVQDAPKILDALLYQNLINIDQLLQFKNANSQSVIHFVACYKPRLLERWVLDKKISIHDLISDRDVDGNSVFHWILMHHPKMVNFYIQNDLITSSDFVSIQNKRGHSIGHWVCEIVPEFIDQWVLENPRLLDALSTIFDSSGNTILHWVAKFKCESIEKWIALGFISIHALMKIKSKSGQSICHWISQFSSNTLTKWLMENKLSSYNLVMTQDANGCSILHWLVMHNLRTLEFWIHNKLISIYDLAVSKDVDGNSVLHSIAQFDSDTLEYWVQNGYTTIQYLLEIHNNCHLTVVHTLAQHNPKILDTWVNHNLITIPELLNSDYDIFKTIFDFLKLYAPDILIRWGIPVLY